VAGDAYPKPSPNLKPTISTYIIATDSIPFKEEVDFSFPPPKGAGRYTTFGFLVFATVITNCNTKCQQSH
jgi:hypothetical protein